MPVSLNGLRPRGGSDAANLATRYLCMAPYLRSAMLPDTIIEHGVEGKLPMPTVDIVLVRRHCVSALRQTILRDLAAIAEVFKDIRAAF
jgi:hypothetical protein